MEAYLIGIVTAVMALLIGFAFSIAAAWYVRSTVDRDLALLRADILGNLAEVRREATVRRVIKTLDEVPPSSSPPLRASTSPR